MQKPDGLMIFERHYLPQSLYSLELADIPGIGKRMEQRILAEGTTTMGQLCALTRDRMHTIWGGVLGDRLWLWCRLRKCSNARGKQQPCGKRCAMNVSETHDCKPLAISVRGPGIGSCGRPGCRRFRCTARVLDKRRAGGCGRGMPGLWRSRRQARCLSRPN